MAPSPQGIIDLTGSDSEYDDKEQERRLADISRFLSSSKKNKRKREGKTSNNDGDDDHSVIVIDSDSDDDDGDRKIAASSSLSAQKKKPKVEPEDKKKPSIKQEGQKLAAAKPTSIAEDGLEVVENVGPRMVAAAAAAASTGDDDVVLEGVANEVRLPHLRQDCTQHPFAPQNLPYWFTTGHTLDLANMEKNEKHCDLCFCYVCDCPVKDCDKWYKHQASRRAENNHCCAMNNNSLWQRLRKEAKKSTTPGVASAPSAAAAASAASNASGSTFQAPPGRHFPRNCPLRRVMQCKDCWCFVCDKEGNDCLKWYSHRHADPAHTHWQGERAMQLSPTFGRSGPFPPDTAGASNDRYLTQCRHCSWFIRREMNNMRHTKKSCDDWCVVCGRVASVKSFAVENDNGLDEEDMKDWYTFGEKTIPFRIHAHDPRLFSHFKSKWEENPNWEYNEAEREEEVFLHLVGKSPSLETLMEKMAYASDDKIPKTGESKEERDQTDAVIVDSPNDINLITILSSRGVREYSFISASWDKQLRSGELKIRFCLPKSAFLNNHGSLNELKLILPAILATWYDLNFDIEELGLRMQPSTKGIVAKLKDCTFTMSVPYGTRSLRMKDHIPSASQFIKSKAEEISTAREARKNDYKLCASDGERGGLSSTDVTFQACLARFFQEHFPTIIQRVSWSSNRTYTTDIIGLCDGQIRGLYSQYHDCLEEKVVDSVCGFTDSSVAKALFSDNASHAVVSDTLSTNTLMAWLENLGHVSEPYVEGINVELLPFQKQALKWAVERERTPGGIQSFYWAKVPATEGRGEDLYFNPLLSQFRKDKPALARGGILAAAMGLGKTIISLGLILKNPAPNLPRSGSSIASLNTAPTPTSGQGWDKTLYAKTSLHNAKRGSIISRGTLVICPVSLVGQWIEEAKSRLENPGLVYPYHGQNRKRDANMLAKAEIVVTTYQILASDATYHKNKGDETYCAPLEQVRWWRIIADEGHSLREGNTQRNHAVQALVADNKWIVTGTPMSTDPKEMKNLFKFLGIEESTKMFSLCTGNPPSRRRRFSSGGDDGNTSVKFSLLMFLLRPILLRYSHNQKYRGTGTTLMSLPPMKKRTIEVTFSAVEKKEFEKLEKSAQSFYLDFRRRHIADMSKHFLKVSAKLLPLRVASSGGKYPISEANSDAHDDDDSDGDDSDDDIEAAPAARKKRSSAPVKYSDFVFKSKATLLLAELKRIRDEEPDSKSLIFSQFGSTLEYLQELLPDHGFSFRTLKGSMSMKQRAKALHDFQNDPPTTVFLLSLRAGAVGINLTQANRVFLMEPGFNPALEAQAIGRVHRLGQKRNVEICRLVIKDSFESRMVEFLKKKYKLTFDDDSSDGNEREESESDDNEEENDLEMDKKKEKKKKDILEVAQVPVGNLLTERAQIVTEEFDELFGVQGMVNQHGETSDENQDGDAEDNYDAEDDLFPDAAMSGCI